MNNLINKLIDYSLYNKKVKLTFKETSELLKKYITDKNSSTLREQITLRVAGINFLEGKFDYDGYDDKGNYYEVKTNCIHSDNLIGKKKYRKLDGMGSYSDMTWKRHHVYIKENPEIIISGFVDGVLIYIIKFPYNILKNLIEAKLMMRVGNVDCKHKYLRKVSFSYTHWKKYLDKVQIIFITNNKKYLSEKYISKRFLNFLLDVKKKYNK